MTAYYNEIDPHAAQWLRNLIHAGQDHRPAPKNSSPRTAVGIVRDKFRAYDGTHHAHHRA